VIRLIWPSAEIGGYRIGLFSLPFLGQSRTLPRIKGKASYAGDKLLWPSAEIGSYRIELFSQSFLGQSRALPTET